MNDVALRANDVLRNDVMLRINDVALRANGFTANMKMPIGIFEQGSRNDPLPCLFRGDICDCLVAGSLFFRYFLLRALLKCEASKKPQLCAISDMELSLTAKASEAFLILYCIKY